MPFLTQGKTNWKFLLIVIVLAVIVGGIVWIYQQKVCLDCIGGPPVPKSNLILFEKIESWGSCPPDTVCGQTTKFYESGKLVLKGEKSIEKQLNKEIIENIKNQIKSSGIMNKDCSGKFPLPDYSADYTLNFEGKIKKIRLPNCEEDLKGIESIIQNETADWKTYRNEEYGFEIKYPKLWLIEKNNPEGVSIEDWCNGKIGFIENGGEMKSVGVRICNNPNGLSFAEWLDYYEESTGYFMMKEPITIDGVEGVLIGHYLGDTYLEEILLLKENKIYIIALLKGGFIGTVGPIEDKEGIYNQMLSTFKFIDEFCGTSSYGSCSVNSDCITDGCSGQVCRSKNEEGIVTTCEYKDCYNAQSYGLDCKCVDKKCQWAE